MKYSAVIIGLGQIGQGYDSKCTDASLAITHASGFHYHPAFHLLGGVDPCETSRIAFETKYKKRTSADIDALLATESVDVVSIAVPTNLHFSVFNKVVQYAPKAIICEKPIASSLSDAQKMIAKSQEYDCALIVNYIRRFEPGTTKLRDMLRKQVFGEIYKGIAWYSKGLYNNGSHLIDLLIYFFGEVTEIHVIDKGRCRGEDPEPDFKLHFGSLTVYFLAGKAEPYALNAIELIGTRGRIQYASGGEIIEYQLTRRSPVYSDYTVLENEGLRIETDFDHYQTHVLDNLAEHLDNRQPLKSDGWTAAETLKTVEHIQNLIGAEACAN